MQDLYLTEESKKELIKVLTDEYEKILISETISKSNRSAMEKQQIAEIVDYLQNNQNVTYADLSKLNESWSKILGKIAGKIGRKVLGPIGTALDVWDAGTQAYELYKELTKPRPEPPPEIPVPGGGSISPQALPIPGIGQVFQGGGLRETTMKIPENLPESMKAFWKDRLTEKM